MAETPRNGEPDRRDVIKTAGKIGLIVPPAMTFLLSTSMSSKAIAKSGNPGGGGSSGGGSGGGSSGGGSG
jgi:hypothetical protein